jgi:tol-pal system protein YbgF
LLGQAKGDYFAGQYDAAVSGFETVIRNFPGTQTAAEAQYYIGESYFRGKRFADAITAYDAVIQTYPKFVQVPDAYYKRGLSQEGAGLMDEARATFEFAMKNFADTTPGQLAKQGYERVTRQAPPPRR